MTIRNKVFIDVDLATDGDKAVIADLFVSDPNGEGLEVKAIALRDPSDKFDIHTGQTLAIGRALERAGRRLQRRAAGFVKHQDDVKLIRQEQKANRKKKGK